MRYRLATEADAEALLAIYGQYIETAITFECRLPSIDEFRKQIRNILLFYPYLVAEEDGRIIGYAYAHRHMQREAYQWNAELSIYLDQKATSKGIGTEPAKKLLPYSNYKACKKSAVVSLNLTIKVMDGLHEKLGFYLVGTYRNAGFKAGRWYDVSWFQKDIGKHLPQPEKPISLCELKHEQINLILSTPML